MTIEEAIVVLKCAMPNSSMGCGESDEEIEEAMTMAIKAMEEQQNPNSIRINFVGEEEAKEFDEYLKNQQPKEPVLDKIKDEIVEEKEYAYADFERYNEDLGQDWEDDFRYGMERCVEIIDKYNESEV